MLGIVSTLEGSCSVGNSALNDSPRGGMTRRGGIEKCENVSGLFQVYFLLESWSTTLDLQSVPVYI